MNEWQKTTRLMPFQKEALDARSEKNKLFVSDPVGMRFIDEHFGLRPGCIHTLMGSTGSGKSTLTQSMLLNWGRKNNVLIYLTEESAERYELKLFEKGGDVEYLSPNLHFMHESELLTAYDSKNFKAMLKKIEQGVAESGAQILLIDNLTTSSFYDGKFDANIPILSGLRGIAAHYKIPVLVIVHTKKGATELTKGLLEPDDVRGSASIANTSDYFYTFYRVGSTTGTGTKRWSAFIFVNKARDHDTQGNLYKLRYEFNRGYVSDEPMSFLTFKELMKERDRL